MTYASSIVQLMHTPTLHPSGSTVKRSMDTRSKQMQHITKPPGQTLPQCLVPQQSLVGTQISSAVDGILNHRLRYLIVLKGGLKHDVGRCVIDDYALGPVIAGGGMRTPET